MEGIKKIQSSSFINAVDWNVPALINSKIWTIKLNTHRRALKRTEPADQLLHGDQTSKVTCSAAVLDKHYLSW